MTDARNSERPQQWVWRGGGGGVAEVVCVCGQRMRLQHSWNKASLWQCDDCRTTVRVKRQSKGERNEVENSSN